MDLLLDTHAIVWWLADDPALTDVQRRTIGDRRNTCYVSAATVWEISIKQALGKIAIDADYTSVLRAQGFVELPVSWRHALAVQSLPHHHRDPFDRILIAQARTENLVLVSTDPDIARYEVRVM